MPKQTTPAMEAHIAQTVTTLATCVYIEQESGKVIRMTDHDRDLTVGGEKYFSNIGFNLSSIESTVGLTVDNASMVVGVDGLIFSRSDFSEGRMINAKFGAFHVNWQAPDSGTIWLKKGFIGKITWSDTQDEAGIELLGITSALSGRTVEQYSQTCRAQLGDDRCNYCNLPNKIRSSLRQYTTGDFFLKPSNETNLVIPNGSFESDGLVPLSTTGITTWDRTPGSQWAVENSVTANDGAYYLKPSSSSTSHQQVYQTVSTSGAGILAQDVVNGQILITAHVDVATTTQIQNDIGKTYMYLEAINASGVTLQRVKSKVFDRKQRPVANKWYGMNAVILLHPDTTHVKIGIDAGPLSNFIYDNVSATWSKHSSRADWNNSAYKVVKLFPPTGDIDPSGSVNLQNNRFSKDGLTANTDAGANIIDWAAPTGSWWSTSGAIGALSPVRGQFMLVAGDNSSGTPNQTYEIAQERQVSFKNMKQEDLLNGWWYAEAVVWFANLVDNQSNLAVGIRYYDVNKVVLKTITTTPTSSTLVGQWDAKPIRIGGVVPDKTNSVEIFVQVTTGAGSVGNMAVDMADLAVYTVAYEGALDPERGQVNQVSPAYPIIPKEFVVDNEALVQAQPLNFGYGQVSGSSSTRTFISPDIDYSASQLYTGIIYWLTGDNAGTSSSVRIFDPSTGTVSLYRNLAIQPNVGDKFIFSKGCDKTIDTCADTFNNAVNFRGEPYLPGTDQIVTFLTQG